MHHLERVRTGVVLAGAALSLALAPAGPARASEPGAPAPACCWVTDVTVVDVERGVAVPHRTVVVEGDRVARIGRWPASAAPRAARVVDGRGLFLLPGLVDAHVHDLDPPVFHRAMVANGVLLVRDMGMPNEFILGQRERLNRGEEPGPEMVATGTVLDGDPPLVPPIARGVKTPAEGRAAVRDQASAGADQVKVYSRLDPEVFHAIVDEARSLRLPVVGHVPESVDLEEAARAGMASSEHFFGFDRLLARLLGASVPARFAGMGSQAGFLARFDEVDRGAWREACRRIRASGMAVCPTVVAFRAGAHMSELRRESFPGREIVSPTVLETWKSQWATQDDLPDFVWRNWARMVRDLDRAGVPLMVGTDLLFPGVLPGEAVHEEMAIWQDAGIAPARILRAATLVPARLAGRADRFGRVRPGMTASMVLVRANPLDDVRNARLIEGVFLRGRYLDRTALDRLLDEAKVAAGRSGS